MPTFVYTAIVSSFVLVSLIKGPWGGNFPFFVAAIIGALIAAFTADYFYPGSTDDTMLRYIITLCGGGFGIYAVGKYAD